VWLRRAVAHHGGVVQPGQRAGTVRLGRVDISKVRLALAAVRREQVEPERAIADAQVLGVRDLKERYHRLPIGESPDDRPIAPNDFIWEVCTGCDFCDGCGSTYKRRVEP
jgi:hypothetical protein